MENLDLEEVDKEMAINKAAQSSVPKDGAPKKAPADDAFTSDDAAADA